nr:MAG TPA: hypothetical protein [Inoviridae sp.]
MPLETASNFHQQSWCRKGSRETFNCLLGSSSANLTILVKYGTIFNIKIE